MGKRKAARRSSAPQEAEPRHGVKRSSKTRPPRLTAEEADELILQRLDRIDERLNRLDRRFAAPVVKATYTPGEVAEKVERSAWTMRQLCKAGLVPGAFKVRGRGHGQWRIPHDAFLRLQAEGVPQLPK